MEEEEEIVNKDCYYKEEPYNEFYNYTIHGLNIEGIKRYYLIPVNSKYHHMIRLNKDLKKVIENSQKLSKERQKKYDRNNIYDDERLIKMYGAKKGNDEEKDNDKNAKSYKQFNTINNLFSKRKNNNISKISKLLEQKKPLEKPIQISLDKDIINNKIGNKDLKQNILKNNLYMDFYSNNKKPSDANKFGVKKISKSFNKNYNINTVYNLRKVNKFKKSIKESDLPMIRPRKIIIEYNLVNSAGIEKEGKNLGHNSYMGAVFNPYNYSFATKNRTSRNVYGSLFLH